MIEQIRAARGGYAPIPFLAGKKDNATNSMAAPERNGSSCGSAEGNLFYERFIALLRSHEGSEPDLMAMASSVMAALPRMTSVENPRSPARRAAAFIEDVWSANFVAQSELAFHQGKFAQRCKPVEDRQQPMAVVAMEGAAIQDASQQAASDGSGQQHQHKAHDAPSLVAADTGPASNQFASAPVPDQAMQRDDIMMMVFADMQSRQGEDASAQGGAADEDEPQHEDDLGAQELGAQDLGAEDIAADNIASDDLVLYLRAA